MTKILTLFLGLGVALSSCHSGQSNATAEHAEDSSLNVKTVSINVPEEVSGRMQGVVKQYYSLKDAFVESDTAAADRAAAQLSEALAALPMDVLKAADSVKFQTAGTTIGSLQSEIAGLIGEPTKQGKLQEFQMISDLTYELLNTIGLKGQTVYREFCPMAFDGKGAYWLSATGTIRNPYYGHEMLTCGEVKEALKF